MGVSINDDLGDPDQCIKHLGAQAMNDTARHDIHKIVTEEVTGCAHQRQYDRANRYGNSRVGHGVQVTAGPQAVHHLSHQPNTHAGRLAQRIE